MEITDLPDNHTFARAVVTAFHKGQHDPSFGEIYTNITGESNGDTFNASVAQVMRNNVARIKDYVNSFGVGAVVLSHWYYAPITRTDFEPSAERVMPPDFRELPATTPEEAALCLAHTGWKRVPFGFMFAKTKNPGLLPVVMAAQQRDASQSAGRARSYLDKITSSYLANQLTQEEARAALSFFDEALSGDPKDPQTQRRLQGLKQIGAVLPKLISIAV